jgi:hypothetical protein
VLTDPRLVIYPRLLHLPVSHCCCPRSLPGGGSRASAAVALSPAGRRLPWRCSPGLHCSARDAARPFSVARRRCQSLYYCRTVTASTLMRLGWTDLPSSHAFPLPPSSLSEWWGLSQLGCDAHWSPRPYWHLLPLVLALDGDCRSSSMLLADRAARDAAHPCGHLLGLLLLSLFA